MRSTITLLGLILVLSVFGQKVGIQGKILDAETNQPLPYSQIAVLNAGDTTIVSGSVANDNGDFSIEKLKQGEYTLVVTFLGYEPKKLERVELRREQTVLNLGNIKLDIDRKKLAEFRARGQATTTVRRIEKQVYNADEFLSAKGGTAVDLLKNIPSVQISPDGEVSVRGTGDFLVYLNGKPTQIEPSVLLAQIGANAVDKVELITVPTARYDSQGKGGIINITTKRSSLDGTSVTATLMGGGTPQYEDFDPLRYGASINFMHQQGKVSLSGGLDYSSRDVRGRRVGEARILQEEGDGSTYYWMNADGDRPEWYENYAARLGLDIALSDNDKLGFGFYHGKRIEGRAAYYTYDNFFGDINGTKFNDSRNNVIYNPNSHQRDGLFSLGTIDYSHLFQNKSKLSISGLIENSRLWGNLKNEDFKEVKGGEQTLGYKQHDNNPLTGVRLDIMYALPLENGSELSFGYQPQYTKQDGEFEYDTLEVATMNWDNPFTEFENTTEQTRWIHAAFIDYKGSVGKLNYIAGLRAEYMDQTFHIDQDDYLSIFNRENKNDYSLEKLDLFPVLHLQYEFNESDNLIFAFSRRINRPATKNMSPFLLRRHYEVFLVGDPSLKPEYSNVAELTFTKAYKSNSFSLTGFYRGTENAIYRVNTRLFGNTEEYPWYSGNSVLIRSYTNAGNNRAIGAELAGNIKITDWWKMYVAGSLYNFNINGEIFGFNVDQNSLNYALNANTNITITNNLKFYYTFNLQSATVTAQGQNDLYYMSDAVLSWVPSFIKNTTVSLKAEDLFNSNIKGLDTRGLDVAGNEIFYQETTYYRYGPVFELNIVYAFNKLNGKAKKIDSTFGKSEF